LYFVQIGGAGVYGTIRLPWQDCLCAFSCAAESASYEVPQNSLIPENIHGGFIGWIIEVDSVN
jgi:hypothetical protein